MWMNLLLIWLIIWMKNFPWIFQKAMSLKLEFPKNSIICADCKAKEKISSMKCVTAKWNAPELRVWKSVLIMFSAILLKSGILIKIKFPTIGSASKPSSMQKDTSRKNWKNTKNKFWVRKKKFPKSNICCTEKCAKMWWSTSIRFRKILKLLPNSIVELAYRNSLFLNLTRNRFWMKVLKSIWKKRDIRSSKMHFLWVKNTFRMICFCPKILSKLSW